MSIRNAALTARQSREAGKPVPPGRDFRERIPRALAEVDGGGFVSAHFCDTMISVMACGEVSWAESDMPRRADAY